MKISTLKAVFLLIVLSNSCLISMCNVITSNRYKHTSNRLNQKKTNNKILKTHYQQRMMVEATKEMLTSLACLKTRKISFKDFIFLKVWGYINTAYRNKGIILESIVDALDTPVAFIFTKVRNLLSIGSKHNKETLIKAKKLIGEEKLQCPSTTDLKAIKSAESIHQITDIFKFIFKNGRIHFLRAFTTQLMMTFSPIGMIKLKAEEKEDEKFNFKTKLLQGTNYEDLKAADDVMARFIEEGVHECLIKDGPNSEEIKKDLSETIDNHVVEMVVDNYNGNAEITNQLAGGKKGSSNSAKSFFKGFVSISSSLLKSTKTLWNCFQGKFSNAKSLVTLDIPVILARILDGFQSFVPYWSTVKGFIQVALYFFKFYILVEDLSQYIDSSKNQDKVHVSPIEEIIKKNKSLSTKEKAEKYVLDNVEKIAKDVGKQLGGLLVTGIKSVLNLLHVKDLVRAAGAMFFAGSYFVDKIFTGSKYMAKYLKGKFGKKEPDLNQLESFAPEAEMKDEFKEIAGIEEGDEQDMEEHFTE